MKIIFLFIYVICINVENNGRQCAGMRQCLKRRAIFEIWDFSRYYSIETMNVLDYWDGAITLSLNTLGPSKRFWFSMYIRKKSPKVSLEAAIKYNTSMTESNFSGLHHIRKLFEIFIIHETWQYSSILPYILVNNRFGWYTFFSVGFH